MILDPQTEERGTLVKLVGEKHFAFGNQDRDQLIAGGGRWKYDGHVYTEVVEYHWLPNLVGQTIEFECTLDGDRWYHRSWDYGIDEIWVRVDQDDPNRKK